jgi:subtilisin family serine protease
VQAGIGIDCDEQMFRLSSDDHDRIGHGTACARLILSIASEARVFPIRVFRDRLITTSGLLIRAIALALEYDFKILNLSLGTDARDDMRRLYRACARAEGAGVIIVAAGGKSPTSYPAYFDNVLSVGTTLYDRDDAYDFVPNELIECHASGRRDPAIAWSAGDQRVASSYAAARISGVLARRACEGAVLTLSSARAFLERTAVRGNV